MTDRNRSLSFAVAVLLLAAAAPGQARAADTRTKPAVSQPEVLTSQEREMLAVANDLARRSTEVIERWLTAKEVTEDRLFSALYYPIDGTEPPKFRTDWDQLSDRDILPLEEAALARSSSVAFAVLVDRNGYLPTHNQKFAQPLTGNLAVDFVNNRTKRIFDNRVVISSARSEADFLLQRYQRDTGEALVEIAVPVTIRGRHFGAVRVDFRPVDGN